jgi:2-C-methyl-D-erythritol 2,4-cyclodiphosphate synthase
LLRHVHGLMQTAGYRLLNADMTVIAQAPKLAAHIPQMRQSIADDLQTSLESVSVKATTTERMGFTGRGEGIATLATVMLETDSDKSRPDFEL